ncbi:MAG: Gfo/Idh/MocA family oxidoreductase [Kiritimatiellae bacterium]|nr:Gfo/Idh/MocA family oxidoreductase [Kiritimatiellia bacterium]
MKVGFAIVGTGMIAEIHAQALQRIEEAELVAVCSRSLEHAAAFTARFGGKPFDDLERMLALPEVDVLIIATPSGAHLEPALAAARAGKHVLCEKPLELTTERIDRMIAAHAAAGTRLGCIFQIRYQSALEPIREALAKGRFGTLTYGGVFVPWWREMAYYTDSDWHGTRALDRGGALTNQAIHMIDLLCDLMPPVESVTGLTASIGHPGIETEDAAVGAIRFKGGALGLIHATTSAWPGRPKRLEIAGTAGHVVCEDNTLTVFRFRDEGPEDEVIRRRFAAASDPHGASKASALTPDLHEACFRDFIRAVTTGGAYRIDGASARKSMVVIEQLLGHDGA